MRSRILALTLALGGGALMVAATAPAGAGPEPARSVDLSRLAGRWYLVARLPGMTGQHGLGAQVEYRLDDGRLEESYLAHSGSLDGPLEKEQLRLRPEAEQPARWILKQGWFSSKERLLLYVSPGYRRAIIGDPDSESAWVLAREPEIPEWSYAGLLARLVAQGFDVSKLKRVVQKPEQLGKAGFEGGQ